MRIAIFGAGGAGGYFGGRLALAGGDVVFLARGAHLAALRRDGMVLDGPDGERRIAALAATDDPAAVGPVDVVLLAVKTWQVAPAVGALAPLLGPETFVVPLQNGVETAAQLVAALGAERVVGGVCGTVSWVAEPGRIRSLGEVHFVRFGELDGRASRRCERLLEEFQRAGVRAEVPADIEVASWEKFLFVVPMGGVGAVTRMPIGIVRALPETRRLLAGAMREIFELGRARGVALADGAVERSLGFVDALAAEATSSLQRDLAAGRRSELEAWSGAVVRLGRAAGAPVPIHDVLYGALLPLELAARGELDATPI